MNEQAIKEIESLLNSRKSIIAIRYASANNPKDDFTLDDANAYSEYDNNKIAIYEYILNKLKN